MLATGLCPAKRAGRAVKMRAARLVSFIFKWFAKAMAVFSRQRLKSRETAK
jgi:hypothetical protein